MRSYYESLFSDASQGGTPKIAAAGLAASAFLDGKPERRGKIKATATDRHEEFWSASFLYALPKEAWTEEALVLALARYFGQDRFAYPALVAHVAAMAPEAVQRAARYAGLVLRQDSPRWREIEALADTHPVVGELVKVFRIFREAHQLRAAEVEHIRQHLIDITPVDMLVYASLYAFEHLIPEMLEEREQAHEGPDVQESWDAIDDILHWTLATCDLNSLRLNDQTISASLRKHLIPFLTPSREGPPPLHDLYRAFSALVAAQIELNAFIDRSADAYSYDDSIRFVRQGDRLEIVETNAETKAAWQRDGVKLIRLHHYWLYRGMEALTASPETLALVSPAHLEANLQAFAKAMGTWLQLQEVYGVAKYVQTETGSQVETFRALLATELMTAFFIEDFLMPYQSHLRQFNHPWLALSCLSFGGLLQATMQNRFPITWSDKAAKIDRITPWTVSPEHPQGQTRAAEAILDFWTSDWTTLAEQMRRGEAGLRPLFHERPVLKIGNYLFQLPWMMAVQNNATAAINNLRRLGARRKDARDETRRIEQRLGALFGQRGFQVLVSHELPAQPTYGLGAEEIDLLCARDGWLLVLELKSTYLRRSVKDAWMHRHSTLRKAGLQLHRKVEAVCRAVDNDGPLQQALGLKTARRPEITAWIVDTSIECDHERFHGFLKVSVEEVLIALRDDGHLLNDPEGLFYSRQAGGECADDSNGTSLTSLYPNGFTAGRMVEVIESASVWRTV